MDSFPKNTTALYGDDFNLITMGQINIEEAMFEYDIPFNCRPSFVVTVGIKGEISWFTKIVNRPTCQAGDVYRVPCENISKTILG